MFILLSTGLFILLLLFATGKINIAPYRANKTYISDSDLIEFEQQEREKEIIYQAEQEGKNREIEYRANIERLRNEEMWNNHILPVYLELDKKEKTLQDMILELGDKVDGLTLDDYYKNPKHLKVETDDLKENEDGSFELKVAYKVEKRKVGDVVEF